MNMKKIPVSELKAGMKFTKPVYVDEANILVPEKVEIREKDLERLGKWSIESVLTEGTAISQETVLKDAADKVETVMDSSGGSEKKQLYRTSVAQTDRVFNELKVNRTVDKREIDRIVDRVLRATVETPEEMLAFVLRDERSEPSLGLSAVNTAILSVLVGATLKLDQLRLKTLATAALLHDAGMVKVPDAIITKRTNLNTEEIKKMRAHPLYSYQIISKVIGYPEEVGLIALQHHERWDGKGYPRKMSEKKISVEARIITVADAFEAMVKEKPYRNSMIAYTAMRQLLNDNSRRFDSEVLKVFIKSIGIYPLGSYVLLNNGSIGRVIKVNESAPLRPAVRLLVDKSGKKYENDEGAILDLTKESEVFIARAIDPKLVGAKKSV